MRMSSSSRACRLPSSTEPFGVKMPTYRIHPGIGIARVGNSESEFCIAPEVPAGLPLECDVYGNSRLDSSNVKPVHVTRFKDGQGRIKRQAARFQVFVYDDKS